MKNLLQLFNCYALVAAGILIICQPAALAQSQEQQKKFSKTYTVSPDAELSINNQFGNVVIHSWSKNQVKADVSILVKHGNGKRAQELLNNIEIIEDTGEDDISLQTSMGKIKLKGNSSVQVNYDVYMPASATLTLVNKFGNTSLPNLEGNTDIRQSFGNLVTGTLAGDENKLFVEFSEGSSKIGNVKNLLGNFSFSNISITGLTGEAEIHAEHCGKFALGVGGGLASLELNAAYTDVAIDLAESFSGKFDVSTNFGDFRYDDRINVQDTNEDERSGPQFKFNYAGEIGGGGAALLSINSNFSSIDLR